jgi:glycosyltransferase involved in cell wall biosynthesis
VRIGFVGNANNYPFMLARAMRLQGHDVVFCVTSEARLDRPEFRYADIPVPYPDWIVDFAPRWKTFFPTPWRQRCIELLRTCDAVVLNQLGPSMHGEVGRPAIILLTGSDLEYFGNPETLRGIWRERHREPAWLAIPLKRMFLPSLIRRQREGIRHGVVVSYFWRGLVDKGDRMLDELGVGDERRVFFLMTEPDVISYCPPPHNSPLRVFCATRLNWKGPVAIGTSELDYKGSDIMIRGLGLFHRRTGARLDIRLVRKGLHVPESEALVAEERLVDQVQWLGEMTQTEVLQQCRDADIVFEQFGRSVVAMAGLDAMATGRPVIANARPEIVSRAIPAPSPVCHATTPEEVARQLERLAFDPAERERVGLASRSHVTQFYSASRAADALVERLAAAVRR